MHHLQIRQNALLLTFSNRQIVIISPHSISINLLLKNQTCWQKWKIVTSHSILFDWNYDENSKRFEGTCSQSVQIGSKLISQFIKNFLRYSFLITVRDIGTLLQTVQMKLILLCVCAEPAILGSAKTALKSEYEIQVA